MALTSQGRRLTEDHRNAQIALASQGEAVARDLWSSVGAGLVQERRDVWLAQSMLAASAYFQSSARLAADYISSYRRVEADGLTGPIVLADFDPARVAVSLTATGPATYWTRRRAGDSATEAHRAARNSMAGAFRRQTMAGGRQAIDLTAKADTKVVGWRRVTDGSPCAFCAMLASRGPVYGAQNAARAVADGRRYHDYCGCSAELVYGAWEPTTTEQGWIDDYQSAATDARAETGRASTKAILAALRQQGYR